MKSRKIFIAVMSLTVVSLATGPAAIAALVTVDMQVSASSGQAAGILVPGTPGTLTAEFDSATGNLLSADLLIMGSGVTACVNFNTSPPCSGATMFPIVTATNKVSDTITVDGSGVPTGGVAMMDDGLAMPVITYNVMGDLSAGTDDVSFTFMLGAVSMDATGDWQIVPVPAAVWLFGSALGLLGWVRRRTVR